LLIIRANFGRFRTNAKGRLQLLVVRVNSDPGELGQQVATVEFNAIRGALDLDWDGRQLHELELAGESHQFVVLFFAEPETWVVVYWFALSFENIDKKRARIFFVTV
jgi:hypothetical protein